jgi:hypothetical protein
MNLESLPSDEIEDIARGHDVRFRYVLPDRYDGEDIGSLLHLVVQ